jgi:hypothetical protein
MKKRSMSVDFANKANNQSPLEDLRDFLETLDTFLALEDRILSSMGDDDPRRAYRAVVVRLLIDRQCSPVDARWYRYFREF